jgi:hypothetical protein
MAKKPDLVVEAVRYGADGKINLVRGFERRGPTYSDWALIERARLVEMLRKGKRIVIGSRKEFLASTFETGNQVLLADSDAIATSREAKTDNLEGAPYF